MSKEENTPYSFQGDNAKLVDSIKSLLALDSKDALVPNGIGGLARQLLESAVERLGVDAQPVAGQSRFTSQKDWQPCSYEHHLMVIANPSEWPGYETRALFTRSDAGEVDRLNTVVEQQKSLIASLRSDLRDSYSIDAAVQEEHLDLEAAAKKLAACMDYPWEHMPEQGRVSMRDHAKAIVSAALSASTEVQS